MASLGNGCNFLCVNPHNSQETWMIAGNTRRHITSIDEYNWWIGLGVTRLLNPPLTAGWFDSIPIATG